MNLEQTGSPSFLALQSVFWSSLIGILLRWIVLLGLSQGIILSSWCINVLIVGFPGNWVSCADSHWSVAGFIWFLEHCAGTCYRLHTIASGYEVLVLCPPHLNPLASLATHSISCPPLGPGGSWMLSQKLSGPWRIYLGTFSVIATQLLWQHVRYRTMTSRGILLKLSAFPYYSNQGIHPRVCWFSQICLDFSSLFNSVSPLGSKLGCDRSLSHSLSLSFFSPGGREYIYTYIYPNFLKCVFSTFPETKATEERGGRITKKEK